MTNDSDRYVYLSDGGHFDNMGLYELVRRRCYRIVIVDGEQDESYKFEGIGMAIRKCRIDFGVEITLDLTNLRVATATSCSEAHFAQGKIKYPETAGDDAAMGDIVYLKLSLTGKRMFTTFQNLQIPLPNEPVDVVNYKLQHDAFPHDTTLNQWFTESQFESYRRLGQHVVEEVKQCSGWAQF